MKTKPIQLFVAALACCFFWACGSQKEGVEIAIGTRDIGHGTRIGLICRDSQGNIFEKSLQKFETITCGSQRVDPKDYLKGEKKFGPFPGHEDEYQKYIERVKKE